MNKKKKELVIIIPMIVLAGIISFTLALPYMIDYPEETYIANQCQEGWFKYESEKGILCAKSEMTQEQVDDFFG